MPETTATGPPLADIFVSQNESNWLFHQVNKMFLTLSKPLWKFQGVCGPEQLRVVNCNAVPKGATAHLGSDETVKQGCPTRGPREGSEWPARFFSEMTYNLYYQLNRLRNLWRTYIPRNWHLLFAFFVYSL